MADTYTTKTELTAIKYDNGRVMECSDFHPFKLRSIALVKAETLAKDYGCEVFTFRCGTCGDFHNALNGKPSTKEGH